MNIQQREHGVNPEMLSELRDSSSVALICAYQRYGRMVYNICLRKLNDPQAAEDATQAVFLLLIRKVGSLGPGQQWGGWLQRAADLVARTGQRAVYRRQKHEREVAVMPEPVEPANPEDEALWREAKTQLDEAVARLPKRYRIPLVMVYYENLPQKEAARILGIQDGNLRARLFLGIERLRRQLGGDARRLSAPALIGVLGQHLNELEPPHSILPSLLAAANKFPAGAGNTAGLGSVQPYLEGAMKAMFWSNVKFVAVWMVTLLLALGGAGICVNSLIAEENSPVQPASEHAQKDGLSAEVVDVTRADEKFLSFKLILKNNGSMPVKFKRFLPPLDWKFLFEALNGKSILYDVFYVGSHTRDATTAPEEMCEIAAGGTLETTISLKNEVQIPKSKGGFVAQTPDRTKRMMIAELPAGRYKVTALLTDENSVVRPRIGFGDAIQPIQAKAESLWHGTVKSKAFEVAVR
jgi:RNA polymerase sigma factor (sigma-70 family)